MAVRWVGFNLLSVTQSILEIYVFPESNPYFSIFTCIKTSKHSLKTCFISSVSLFFRSPAYFCVFVLSPSLPGEVSWRFSYLIVCTFFLQFTRLLDLPASVLFSEPVTFVLVFVHPSLSSPYICFLLFFPFLGL